VKGASAYPVNMQVQGFAGLAKTLIEHKITIFALVPSLFRQFAVTVSAPLPHLRVIKLVGEPTLRTDVDLYKRFFPRECVLINRFGTTETAPVRYYFMDHESDVTDAHAPIGYPVPGSDLVILDSHGVEVSPGDVGEIVIRSRHLATGYWNKPEITHVTFKPDPQDPSQRIYMTGDMGLMRPDGCVVHLGRKDQQVQIRGYRVELAEIEITIRELEEVADGAVAALDDGGGETYLVGYVVPNGPIPPVSLLRDQLSGKLPSYMIPGRWVFLDDFPRGPNGKLHRKALPAPEAIRAELPDSFVEPATPMEQLVAEKWKRVLKDVDRIGVYDRFFDLGGESLGAMRVIDWLETETGVQLSPIDMGRQTLGQLASFYQSHQTRAPRQSSEGSTGLLEMIARRIFRRAPSGPSEPH
jgi:acyl carrier protein